MGSPNPWLPFVESNDLGVCWQPRCCHILGFVISGQENSTGMSRKLFELGRHRMSTIPSYDHLWILASSEVRSLVAWSKHLWSMDVQWCPSPKVSCIFMQNTEVFWLIVRVKRLSTTAATVNSFRSQTCWPRIRCPRWKWGRLPSWFFIFHHGSSQKFHYRPY